MLNRSHVTEMSQKTRLELENDQISREELEQSVQVSSNQEQKKTFVCFWLKK